MLLLAIVYTTFSDTFISGLGVAGLGNNITAYFTYKGLLIN